MSKTYMEFRDDKSTKFWEVTVAGVSVIKPNNGMLI
jgi:predicted DNA-binding WGR domain protein